MGRNQKKGRGKTEPFLGRSTQAVQKATGFVSALSFLVTQTIALASLFIGAYQPPANQLPKGCTPETLQVRDLPPYEATNEIFWKRHPEVHRRQIRRNEGKYSDEWWLHFDKVSRCRK